MKEEIIRLKDVKKYFWISEGIIRKKKSCIKAVDGISFTIYKGEVIALVGESGCGKTTLGRILVGLEEPTEGEIFFKNKRISFKDKNTRKKIQMIFQDPYASLNPKMKVGEHLIEPLFIHFKDITKQEAKEMALKFLKEVGLTPEETFFDRYPYQLSGGQRQRVVIARAMILHPEFVVADEAVSMIDVSLRASILELLIKFNKMYQLSMLFITHDISTAKIIGDRLGVMYLGNLVELGPVRKVIYNPKHPYTMALLSAIPSVTKKRFEFQIKGEIANPKNPPSGCKFHPRCPFAKRECKVHVPSLLGETHLVACHYPIS